MENRHITALSEHELLAELAECISLEGEAKARAEPIRADLLKRQTASGEVTIEHDGWQSTLKREPLTAAWIERQYGYPKAELPAEVFVETVTLELSTDKVMDWLAAEGFEVRPTYTLAVSRKKITTKKAPDHE